MTRHVDKPLETLRLSPQDQRELIASVDERSQRPVDQERRMLRVNYSPDRPVFVSLAQSGGHRVSYRVLPRNLARHGIAFVHGRFVYPDSRCDAVLPNLSGTWHTVHGKVLRCRHVGGIVHEVSVRLDEGIELPRLVKLTPEQAAAYDAERPPIVSTSARNPDQAPRLACYVRGLGDTADRMGQAVDRRDVATLIDLCTELTASGVEHGFQTISVLAKLVVHRARAEEPDPAATARAARELVQTLYRARARG